MVLAHVAVHPGLTAQQIARALGIREPAIARALGRLADDGLLALAADSATYSLGGGHPDS
ncbi:MarR family transcriptional regulator [Streptomyces pinistramenti]|uniref:MarR family transcriptional regulator n=1 Tax=Streptomyces pinistramenti TaxID=2884812 RepID=UPI001D095849|nr:helix-turn-helix domain-containing protein [Streptomyces pinistramenti]MCB5911073.1 MarR family transcriptional regulator [Streptomyces pinistramenti]